MRKRYSKEFKDNAVKLVTQEGAAVSQVSKDLGITPAMLYKWKNDSTKHKPSEYLNSKHDDEKLKRRLKLLEMENEILKKATAYFAKDLLQK